MRTKQLGIMVGCAFVIGVTLTWTFLGMRAVMDIGGSCGAGGPYVIARECPDGAAALLSIAIPLMVAASLAALFLGAPRLLLVMWVLLFGSLGWNFFEYAVKATDGVDIAWFVCGVVFWGLAAPGLWMLAKGAMATAPSFDGTNRSLSDRHVAIAAGPGLAVGFVLGVTTFAVWA